MQLNLSGHHIEITAALRNYVESKMERLERHFDHVTNVHVVLSVEKLRQKAEATLHVSGANLFADAVHEDMYAAIDAMTDKLDRQVKKHKEKIKNHHQSEGGVKAHQQKDKPKEKPKEPYQSEGNVA
ncbi:MAG: ribosome-associated translation inhibitor RaiA [Candidatus Parabeggiatoa sp. nov. 1]|nr:MAG: ribosome-associated translation inhibitor RaiA [Gammaproteobacteria bacterium]